MSLRTRLASFVLLAFCLLPTLASAQAIVGTAGGGENAVIFPSPGTGLPTPTQVNVTGMAVGARPHGVAYYGSDNALVSDFSNSRIYVVKISTAAVQATITTPGYGGTGTIAVAPGLTSALAMGNSTTLYVIAAPFSASSTISPVTIPGSIASYQTEAIVFNAAGRAFVYHTTGISVLDPPYSAVAFTIPFANGASGAIAISPDGSKLLTTDLGTGIVHIFTAPYSTSSVPSNLAIAGASGLDGIFAAPDGTKALVVSGGSTGVWAISAPFSSSSTVEQIPLSSSFGSFEDVGISADSQLAILTGNANSNAATPFIQAPFTAAGATVFTVNIPGGRGAGAVRFLPPGLAPGLTISKGAPPTVSPGSNLTYTITYGNTGGVAATSVVIKDPVPAGTTFVSATGGGTFAAGVVTWNIGTITAGTSGLTVSFTVNVTAASGSVNNVNYTIEGTGVSPIPGPPVSTTITAGPTPTPTPTPTPAPPPGGAAAPVPALSFGMLAFLATALAGLGLLAIRRNL